MFQYVSEKALREILRIMHSVPAAAYETVKRPPIDLAKLRQRGPRGLRFGLAAPGCEHHAPVGRRKQIALAVLVPHTGIHANRFYQDHRRKASHKKNLNFVQHALRNPFVKGKH